MTFPEARLDGAVDTYTTWCTRFMTIMDYSCVARWELGKKLLKDNGARGNKINIAPERYNSRDTGLEYGPEVDWYASGLILYRSHAKQRLYKGSDGVSFIN